MRMVNLSPSFAWYFFRILQTYDQSSVFLCMFESSVHGYICSMDIKVSIYGILGAFRGSMSYSYLGFVDVPGMSSACSSVVARIHRTRLAPARLKLLEMTGCVTLQESRGKQHSQVWLDVLGAWEDDYLFPEVYPNASNMIRMVCLGTSCEMCFGTRPEPNFRCEFWLELEQGSIAEIQHQESGYVENLRFFVAISVVSLTIQAQVYYIRSIGHHSNQIKTCRDKHVCKTISAQASRYS